MLAEADHVSQPDRTPPGSSASEGEGGSGLGLRATLSEIFHRRNVVLMLATWILFGTVGPFFWSFAADYMRNLGGAPRIWGLLNALTALISMLVVIPGGYIADKRGRKGLLVWGTFLAAFPCFVSAMAGNWRVYFVTAAIEAAFSNVYIPAMHALFQDSIPETSRAFSFSLVDALAWSLPGMISSVVAGYLYERHGIVALRWALITNSAVYLTSALLRRQMRETLDEREAKHAEPISLRGVLGAVRQSFLGISEALSWLKGPLARMMAMEVLSWMVWGLTGGFWFLYAVDVIGVSRFQWGVLEASWCAIYLLLVPIAGRLSDRKGRIKVMRFSPGLFAVLFMLLVFSRGFWSAFVIWVAWAVPDALWISSFEAMWVDLVGSSRRARMTTLKMVLGTTARMGFAALSGYMYEFNPALPFCIAAIIEAISFMIMQTLAKVHRAE